MRATLPKSWRPCKHKAPAERRGAWKEESCNEGRKADLRRHDDLDAPILLLLEDAVPLRGLVEAHAVGDDEGGIDVALPHAVEERPHVLHHVGLAHLEGQALVHG